MEFRVAESKGVLSSLVDISGGECEGVSVVEVHSTSQMDNFGGASLSEGVAVV
jgi:hypothetical protein